MSSLRYPSTDSKISGKSFYLIYERRRYELADIFKASQLSELLLQEWHNKHRIEYPIKSAISAESFSYLLDFLADKPATVSDKYFEEIVSLAVEFGAQNLILHALKSDSLEKLVTILTRFRSMGRQTRLIEDRISTAIAKSDNYEILLNVPFECILSISGNAVLTPMKRIKFTQQMSQKYGTAAGLLLTGIHPEQLSNAEIKALSKLEVFGVEEPLAQNKVK